MEDGPLDKDGRFNANGYVTLPPNGLSAEIVADTFNSKHEKSLKAAVNSLPPNVSWYGLERQFKLFVSKIRSTRREVERRYKVKLPAGCFVLKIRRGHDLDGPIIAEVDEKRVRLYKRA